MAGTEQTSGRAGRAPLLRGRTCRGRLRGSQLVALQSDRIGVVRTVKQC